jgi:hypothetical protein
MVKTLSQATFYSGHSTKKPTSMKSWLFDYPFLPI